jgi:hypothetical protein
MQRRRIRDERGLGQALVGRLLKACLDRGAVPMLAARARRLRIERSRVVGVEVETAGGTIELAARRA